MCEMKFGLLNFIQFVAKKRLLKFITNFWLINQQLIWSCVTEINYKHANDNSYNVSDTKKSLSCQSVGIIKKKINFPSRPPTNINKKIKSSRFWWNIFRKSEGKKRRTEEETWPRHDMRFKTCWQKIYVSVRDKRIFSSDRESSSDENLTPFYRTLQLLLHALLNKYAFYVIGSSLTFLTTLHNFFLWFMDCKRN